MTPRLDARDAAALRALVTSRSEPVWTSEVADALGIDLLDAQRRLRRLTWRDYAQPARQRGGWLVRPAGRAAAADLDWSLPNAAA
jgi:hypothetical protein